MKTPHTEEPWDMVEGEGEINRYIVSGTVLIADCFAASAEDLELPENYEANSKRIISCVNACVGMENPALQISRLIVGFRQMADRISSMRLTYELPEEASAIIAGELDAANGLIDRTCNGKTPLLEELRIQLEAAEHLFDSQESTEVADPIGDGIELVREALQTLKQLES